MKKYCISFLIFAIIILSAVAVIIPKDTKTEYLRIHIRANSNAEIDQNVKYIVKDKIVEFLTPYLAECKTKEKAQKLLNEKEKDIEKIADTILFEKGFAYTSDAKIKTEKFPTRIYEDLTLESGYYDALIINLGSGEGDNWWCVVYPPLCFTGNKTGYIYKSKIVQIINDFKNKKAGG